LFTGSFKFTALPHHKPPQILQNLGKADKTTDEIFDEHLQNFNTQQVNSTRLHKDINNYLRCIRGRVGRRRDEWGGGGE
jgi:hypothetical protein